ncbi:hypothetical protein SPHINGO8AM_80271 [Sphingomonas sp. 8AM]|nr:hypothetical protein SPHINGO8AM_80271 [Sphingomonas sp. 8AM]
MERPPIGLPEATWSQNLAMLCRREIDQGRRVRVSLPGAAVPLLVEDAYDWTKMLVVDPQGRRYYAAHPAGVVVLCAAPATPGPDEKPYWANVDGGD